MLEVKLPRWFLSYMFFIALFGNVDMWLQVIKILDTKSAGDISTPAYSITVIALGSWSIYGFLVRDKLIFIGATLGALGAIAVLIGKAIYV